MTYDEDYVLDLQMDLSVCLNALMHYKKSYMDLLEKYNNVVRELLPDAAAPEALVDIRVGSIKKNLNPPPATRRPPPPRAQTAPTQQRKFNG